MKKVFGIFRQRWFVTLLGMLALSVLIWFLGPLFAFAGVEPLVEPSHRVIAILLVLGLWGANLLRRRLSAARANSQVMQGMAGASAESSDAEAESAAEIATLQQRMDEALALLKKARLGGRWDRRQLYQLPWYIFIGPPGSGKTTALANSGLRFPLAERFGNQAIQGVGGTRNCDWWFTDQAVLLDTAGRYTTQDSHQEVDKAAWAGFLDMLRKHRRRRPINGALVAISVSDLVGQTETEREAQARAIRQRIQELHEHLGIRFPVYVLFTKCDLIAGFMEFFDDLDREERAQVWGVSFDLAQGAENTGEGPVGSPLAGFGAEFDALEQRLDQRLVERLQQERDPRRRGLIYGFPQQYATLKGVAGQFLDAVFHPSRFEQRPLLRGVYFTSGTQEGNPIDRLMGRLGTTFGLDRQDLASWSGKGRSYFLTRLFQAVIFPEAGLAGTNLRLERRRAWLQRAAYAGLAGLVVLMVAAWTTSYLRNRAYVDQLQTRGAEVRQQVEALPGDQLDLLATLPLLDAARELAGLPGAGGPSKQQDDPGSTVADSNGQPSEPNPADDAPWTMDFGLYQGDKLGGEALAAYRRLLRQVFLPRLMMQMEDRLRHGANDPDFLFQGLKVYLMLGDPEHFDADLVKAWISLNWDDSLPRSVGTERRRALDLHLQSLFQTRPAPLPLKLDRNLIAQLRATLERVPLALRIYSSIKREALAGVIGEVAEFRVSEAVGRDAALVFVRRGGEPLNRGIPGFFTYDGYHKLFLPYSVRMTQTLVKERWVLGETSTIPIDPAAIAELAQAVRRLYFEDYIRQWETLLADIDVVPLRNLNQAVQVLNLLSAPDSPLYRLLRAVALETTLQRPDAATEQVAEKASDALEAAKRKLARVFGQRPEASGTKPALRAPDPVTRHFARLRELVQGSDGNPPSIERTLALLNELYVHLSGLAAAADRGGAALAAARQQAGAGGVGQRLRTDAGHEPAPMDRWLQALAGASANLTIGGVRGHLNAEWSAKIAPFCRQAIETRYPVDHAARQDITAEDFATFFGPGGLMDAFFQNYLQDFVDTSRPNWRWRASGRTSLGIPNRVLQQFQRAATIRDTFFRGGTGPSVRFQLKPITMDPAIRRFVLDIDGQKVKYSHGPILPTRLQWPGPNSTGQVAIEVYPPSAGGLSSRIAQGPWALFRLLDQARITPTDQPERYQATFTIDNRKASFELWASSVLNPFRLPALEKFRCPPRL